MSYARSLFAAILATTLTTACGGGGDDDNPPCGGAGTLRLTLAYKVNGQTLNPTLINLPTGVAIQAVPEAVGLPASCAGAVRWAFRVTSPRPPAGLNFDGATGVLSGTASGIGSIIVDMELRVDGYAALLTERASFFVSAQ